jgi:signal transduction histidine kinase
VRQSERSRFETWLWEEGVLFALLAGGLALFISTSHSLKAYDLPQAGLALNTAIGLICAIVFVLTAVRFSVDGQRLDLLLACGFLAAAGTSVLFEVAPLLGGEALHRKEAWAGEGGRILSAALIAWAGFVRGRVRSRPRAIAAPIGVAIALLALWLISGALGSTLPSIAPAQSDRQPLLLTTSLAVLALLSLLALVGFGARYRLLGQDLDRWLALAATLKLFAQLHYIFTPLLASVYISQGDFLRLVSYSVLLVGVWRAISAAEFGRAVAEERARVARDIHDGLAQYLFAISTQVNMLENGLAVEVVAPRLKEAAAAAQQEARFAVLALSSASGNAPFDAALRRYVEFLTADGELEVDLEIDESIRLGPDEQIEVFRIVQEGLANVRRHSGARHAEVLIGEHAGRRRVEIRDDGLGFEESPESGGQGLRNMRERAGRIGGAFRLSTLPGRGTSLEVTLRT